VVSSGLKPGEKVITQGTANLKSGAPIKPVPAGAPQKVEPRAGGAGQGQGRRGG
jgi:membrane fusion protein (multidrug efflux system)